jgi:hypothetical protein
MSALANAIPCVKDIELLLQNVKQVSMACYETAYKSRHLTNSDILRGRESLRSLLTPEPHPVLLAKQMLLFAATLRYIPSGKPIVGLSKHQLRITEELAETAITHVTMNDTLVGTLEGLEALIIEAFYHIDSGNIRRGWMTIRRAVMVTQLLGMHSPDQYRFKIINDQSDLDPARMWSCILHADCVLSLLLGLPSSVAVKEQDLHEPLCTDQHGENFHTVCTNIAALILVRNQIRDYQAALAMTRKIDSQLIQATKNMPSAFWKPLSCSSLDINSVEAFHEVQRVWDHVFFHTLVIQAHLPYILCPQKTPEGTYSRAACVNASREILNRDNDIRAFNSTTASCHLNDFMAVIAAMTLVLSHIIRHHEGHNTDNILDLQRAGDRALVEVVLTSLKAMSEARDDIMGVKCASLLQDLLAVEADAAEHQSRPQVHLAVDDTSRERMTLTIRVPYIGSIVVNRDSLLAIAIPTQVDNDVQHDDVTIGGLGTLSIKSVSNTTLPQESHLSDVCPRQQEMAFDHTAFPESLNFNEQMLPDASANIDNWVLQGTDTAFFDSLLRGGTFNS